MRLRTEAAQPLVAFVMTKGRPWWGTQATVASGASAWHDIGGHQFFLCFHNITLPILFWGSFFELQ